MAADTDNGNGRVTLAVLATKVDHLTALVTSYCIKNDVAAHDRETRLQALERRQDVNDEQHKQIVEAAKEREDQIREDQTLRTWAGSVAAAVAGIASAVAARVWGGP